MAALVFFPVASWWASVIASAVTISMPKVRDIKIGIKYLA